MSNYEYKYEIISTKEGYYFRLLPNNSNNQEIGRSVLFPDKSECESALKNFKASYTLLKNNPNLYRVLKDEKGYYFEFYSSDGKLIFYREKRYVQKEKCVKSINRVVEKINSKII